MPSWAVELLKILGFTTPFIYAAGTYRLFHWLDKNASTRAKNALVDWLRGGPFDRNAVSGIVIGMFDRIYTHPLLTRNAFIRSSCISIALFIIFLYEFHPAPNETSIITTYFPIQPGWIITFVIGLNLLTNIGSDYLSLFVVRYFLLVGQRNPAVSALLAAAAGTLIVLSFIVLRNGLRSFAQISRAFICFFLGHNNSLVGAELARFRMEGYASCCATCPFMASPLCLRSSCFERARLFPTCSRMDPMVHQRRTPTPIGCGRLRDGRHRIHHRFVVSFYLVSESA